MANLNALLEQLRVAIEEVASHVSRPAIKTSQFCRRPLKVADACEFPRATPTRTVRARESRHHISSAQPFLFAPSRIRSFLVLVQDGIGNVRQVRERRQFSDRNRFMSKSMRSFF
jgi:hypothetical protein